MRRVLFIAGMPLVAATATAQTSRYLNVNGARIHYVVSGSGPAVVLIHGWALNLREWTDQIAALAPRYRVIALDRRGFGKSTGFADASADPGDIRALLDTLGIRSAILVGHSAGANIAQRFMAAMPDRVSALVLYGGPPPQGMGGRGAPPEERGRGAIARQYGIDSVLRATESLPQFQPGPNRTPAMAARVDSIVKEYSGRDLLEQHAPSGAFPLATVDQVRSWRIPVLFISGVHEAAPWLAVSDTLVHWLPNARRVLIPGGGHGVHFDEPQRFNAALLEFLDHVVVPAVVPLTYTMREPSRDHIGQGGCYPV